jgi:hypothetical protein
VSITSPVTTSSCHDEPLFSTYAEADQQAWFEMSRRRHLDDDFMLAAYFCPRCAGWHVGNPRKQSAQRWSATLG